MPRELRQLRPAIRRMRPLPACEVEAIDSAGDQGKDRSWLAS
jgi:hypothetical protein